MSDERDREPDPDTGAFDADEWFRTQFGAEAPVAPVPPAAEPPVAPVPPPVPPSASDPSPSPLPPSSPLLPPPSPPSAPVVPPAPLVPPGSVDPHGTFAPPPALVEPPPTMPAMLPPAQPAVLDPEATQPSEVIELEPTQPSEIVDGPATVLPLGDAATELMRQPEEGGALDELFGSDSFQEYDDALIVAAPRSSRRGAAGDGGGADGGPPPAAGARAPLGRQQKVLLWIAGSLLALLALVAIFFLGTRIPLLLGPAPGAEPSPTATPSPTPTPTVLPVGPVAPGEYRWDELLGGECLEPYVDAWQEEYTVVDCSQPHTAQLADRSPFALPEGATEQGPYPGEQALAAQISLLCSRPGVIDLVAAAPFTDIQMQGAYAVTEEQWDEGMQDFFCFASRSSGEPLTLSIVPVPAPVG